MTAYLPPEGATTLNQLACAKLSNAVHKSIRANRLASYTEKRGCCQCGWLTAHAQGLCLIALMGCTLPAQQSAMAESEGPSYSISTQVHTCRHLYVGSPVVEALRDMLHRAGDADTNAAIVMGLMGALHGFESIPAALRWPVLARSSTSPGKIVPACLCASQVPYLACALFEGIQDARHALYTAGQVAAAAPDLLDKYEDERAAWARLEIRSKVLPVAQQQ